MKSYWVKQKGNPFKFCNLLVKFKGKIYVDIYNCQGEKYIKEGEVVGEVYEGLSHENSSQIMPHVVLYGGKDISDIEESKGQKSKHWDKAIMKETKEAK